MAQPVSTGGRYDPGAEVVPTHRRPPFRDPDGLEGEVCVANPDAKPGVMNPPGTPAPGYG